MSGYNVRNMLAGFRKAAEELKAEGKANLSAPIMFAVADAAEAVLNANPLLEKTDDIRVAAAFHEVFMAGVVASGTLEAAAGYDGKKDGPAQSDDDLEVTKTPMVLH